MHDYITQILSAIKTLTFDGCETSAGGDRRFKTSIGAPLQLLQAWCEPDDDRGFCSAVNEALGRNLISDKTVGVWPVRFPILRKQDGRFVALEYARGVRIRAIAGAILEGDGIKEYRQWRYWWFPPDAQGKRLILYTLTPSGFEWLDDHPGGRDVPVAESRGGRPSVDEAVKLIGSELATYDQLEKASGKKAGAIRSAVSRAVKHGELLRGEDGDIVETGGGNPRVMLKIRRVWPHIPE